MKKKTHTSQEIQKIWKEAYPKLSESVPNQSLNFQEKKCLKKQEL